MTQKKILQLVRNERLRQDRKWGVQNHPPCKWITIAVEELGEAAEAALEDKYDQYVKELVECAASCVAAIECIVRQSIDCH